MNALMKQAQQMQDQMLQAQEKLKDEVVEASAGGGMVKVKMGGDLTLREITIDPTRSIPRRRSCSPRKPPPWPRPSTAPARPASTTRA